MGYHAHFDPRLIASADQCSKFTERDKILVHHAMQEERRTRRGSLANPIRRLSNDNELIAWASVQAQTAQQALAANMAIRQNILANAVPVLQNVRSGSLNNMTYGSPQTWTVLASNVGLIRRFFLELTGVVNGGAGTFTPTAMGGLANILSNVQFIDQNNRLRINTTGWHLHLAASQKRRRIFGNATPLAGLTDPTGCGANVGTAGTTYFA